MMNRDPLNDIGSIAGLFLGLLLLLGLLLERAPRRRPRFGRRKRQ